MEIIEVKISQQRVKAIHSTEDYIVEYDVTLGENNQYQNISGTIKEVNTKQIVGYVNKSYEFSVRTVNGKENLFVEISQLAIESLSLLDEEVNKL